MLPVTVSTDSTTMTATLQLSIHTGFTYDIANISVFDEDFGFSTGIESSTFAKIAMVSTNITHSSNKCDRQALQSYQFDAGAAAGANMRAGTQTWGPNPDTTSRVISTNLDAVCATRMSTATSMPMSSNNQGRALLTTTISTSHVFIGQACISSGMVNCPVSLQTTTSFPTVLSIITSVPSGVSPTLPQTNLDSVVATSTFGSQAKGIPRSSPENLGASAGRVLDGNIGGVSLKTIVGVSVGLGVPVLVILVTVAWSVP